jgi:hypothetical protein
MTIPEVARRKLAKLALAILTTLCLLTGASAQSIDPDHPAPLGPGVNRGNVDNSGRGHTFFFFAGPGGVGGGRAISTSKWPSKRWACSARRYAKR